MVGLGFGNSKTLTTVLHGALHHTSIQNPVTEQRAPHSSVSECTAILHRVWICAKKSPFRVVRWETLKSLTHKNTQSHMTGGCISLTQTCASLII